MSSEEISSSPKTNEIISTAEKCASHAENMDSTLKAAESDSCTPGRSNMKDDLAISNKKNGPQRCHKCRKKVGLTGLDCRCGNVYCALHRYSNEHGCTFDYKAHGAEEIKKNNPAIIAPKISKI